MQHNSFVSSQHARISPYDKKIIELRGVIEKTAKELQNIVEAKDQASRDLTTTIERKADIERTIRKLEEAMKEAQNALTEVIEKRTSFLNSVKIELKKERQALKEAEELLTATNDKIGELMPIVKELQEFISKESDARERYLETESHLILADKKHKKISALAEAESAEMKEKRESLEGLKNYVADLYGKLITYSKVAKETVEFVNEALKGNVPLRFEIPPGEKEITVDFESFTTNKLKQ